MDDFEVFKISYIAGDGSAYYQARGDIIFQNGQPLLVLEWQGPANDEHPLRTIPLDPARLKELPTQPRSYMYDGAIDVRLRGL